MANAMFTSSISYSPSGGGSLTQGFRVAFAYSASCSGTIDVAAGANSAIDIAFGAVNDVLGFVLQNNTLADIELQVDGNSVYKLAAGGVLMHWSPDKSAQSLAKVTATPGSPAEKGTIEYVVLGN
ncbi:hypothetical protein [Sorangium sp. So ce1389]|uniref:hypothetical protein n=1 Tax=Sorangium sp. So ce1389 TaxID=3133336 RepID=UPI003F628821